MHGFERILRLGDFLGDFALDLVAARRGARAAVAQFLDMDQKLRHAALDRAELIEPRVGGVELGREADNSVFQCAERILLAAREFVALHAVGEAVEQRFDARRQRRAAAGS